MAKRPSKNSDVRVYDRTGKLIRTEKPHTWQYLVKKQDKAQEEYGGQKPVG